MPEEKQDLGRVLELLWQRAEDGSVSAQKVLYEHYRREQDEPADEQDDWSAIYGGGNNVTPLRRAG